MKSLRRILICVTVAAFLIPVGAGSQSVAAPSAAATAPAANRINAAYSVRIGEAVIVVSQPGRGHVGETTVTQGSVSEYYGGKVGSLTLTETVVDPNYAGGNEARIARAALGTSGGTLFGETLVIAKHGERPQASWYMSVVGGTGPYRSATGNMTLMYVKGLGWRLSFDVTLEATPLTQKLTVARVQSVEVASTRPGGLGTTTASTGAVQGGGQFLSSEVTVARAGTTNTRTADASLTLPKGTLLLRGIIARPRDGQARPASYAILGGTGDYLGVRGEARIVPKSPTRSEVSLTYTRLRDGRPETPQVTSTPKRSVDAAVVGAQVQSTIGTLAGNGSKYRTLKGTFDQFTSEFVPVGDVTITSVAARYELSGGSLIIGGVAGNGGSSDLVILGGTSEYAGSRGTVTLTPRARGAYLLSFTLWRGGVGPAS